MQQPPSGRPPRPPGGAPPPGQPPQAGGYPPPGGWGQPAHQPPAYPPPGSSAAPANIPSLGSTPLKRKSRGSLKFLASTCVFSAWITLVLSIVSAFSTFMTGIGFAATASAITAPSSSGPFSSLPSGSPNAGGTGDDLGVPKSPLADLGGAMGGAMLTRFVPPICYAVGAFTLVSGIVTFILFLGLGQACYILIDLEEQSFQQSEALGIIIARLGQGR